MLLNSKRASTYTLYPNLFLTNNLSERNGWFSTINKTPIYVQISFMRFFLWSNSSQNQPKIFLATQNSTKSWRSKKSIQCKLFKEISTTRILSLMKENSNAISVKVNESWQLKSRWEVPMSQWLLSSCVLLVETDGKTN